MYRKILIILSVFSLITFSETDLEKNQKRINQIESQVKTNTSKINTNNSKITKAQREEASIKKEIANLNVLINKLQKEYNSIENEYISLLRLIGKSEKEINASIKKINESTQKIDEGKTDYSNKIKIWNKVSNAKVFKKASTSIDNSKKERDLTKILDQQQGKIKSIEQYKIEVEQQKKKEEIIKSQNEQAAKKVEKTKKELENKRAELRKAKSSQDAAVKRLQSVQKTLKTENSKLEKSNSTLIAEKRKLEAQINAIIKAAQNKKEKEAKENPNSEVVTVKGTGQFMMPINGKVVVTYGQEKTKGITSKGIEIRGSLGQAVKASDTGTVLYSGSLKGLGAVIMIDHGSFITVYGNLSSVSVANGAKVKKGQTIGTLGRDSITKEPNLYFEVRKGVNYVNPLNYL